jgi:hypothetical protein
MQAAYYIPDSPRVVVLDELVWDPEGFELIGAEYLHEEAAIVLEHFGHDHLNSVKMSGFDS